MRANLRMSAAFGDLASSWSWAHSSASVRLANAWFGNFGGEIQNTAVTKPRSHPLGTMRAEPPFHCTSCASNRFRCSAKTLRWIAFAFLRFDSSTTQATG